MKKAKKNLRALHVRGQSAFKKNCALFSSNRNLFPFGLMKCFSQVANLKRPCVCYRILYQHVASWAKTNWLTLNIWRDAGSCSMMNELWDFCFLLRLDFWTSSTFFLVRCMKMFTIEWKSGWLAQFWALSRKYVFLSFVLFSVLFSAKIQFSLQLRYYLSVLKCLQAFKLRF